MDALVAWADQTLPQLSAKFELANAFRYMRARSSASRAMGEDVAA